MENPGENPAEEEKTPHEILLDDIYDKEKSKEDRAQLILDTLANEPEFFYELDFFKNNFYSHVIENFTFEEADKEIFKMLTSTVIKDIKSKDSKLMVDGKELDLFETTFHGDAKSNFGTLNYLARSKRFDFIEPFLQCFIDEDLTDKLQVGVVDKTGKTIFHFLCQFGQPNLAYKIYSKYKPQFKSLALLDLKNSASQDPSNPKSENPYVGPSNSLAEMFKRGSSLKDGDFDSFREELDALFGRDDTANEQDDFLEDLFSPDEMGLSFVHNLCLNTDERFISYFLEKYNEDAKKFKEVTKINDLTKDMNKIDQMSQLSPITSILSNQRFEMCKVIFEHVVLHHTFQIDTYQKDSRFRNIFHVVIYNKSLSTEEKLHLLDKYMLRLSKDKFVSFDCPDVDTLLAEIDLDGFIPLVLFCSSIKADEQQEKTNESLFALLAGKTDFNKILETLAKKPDTSFVHPLILCIRIGLESYFKKFLSLSYTLRKQIIYVDRASGRTSIEYAFDSGNEEFMEALIDALDQVDSFIVDESKGSCITLFDVVFKVIKTAKMRNVFLISKDEPVPIHPTYRWITKLINTVYTKTKDKEYRKADAFLTGFNYSKKAEVEIDIPKPKIMKKMPPRLKQKMMDDYNQKVEEAKKLAEDAPSVTRTGKDIFLECYNNNEYLSFPYLYDILRPSDIDQNTLYTCLEKRKHPVIFEIIFDHCHTKGIWNLPVEHYVYSDEEDENAIHYGDFLRFVPKTELKQFFTELHQQCLQFCNDDIKFMIINQYTKCIDTHYESLKKVEVEDFIEFVVPHVSFAIDKISCKCAEPLIDMIIHHKISMPFKDKRVFRGSLKSMFTKLIFVKNYEYTVKLQDLCLKLCREYYTDLEKLKTTNKNNNEGEDSDYFESINEEFVSCLKELSSFEQYNQLDFHQDPERIIQIVKNFIMMGGYSIFNIGFDTTSGNNTTAEQRKEITRLTKLVNEYKTSKKEYKFYTVLHFLASFEDYNDIVFELFDNEAPITLTIDELCGNGCNLFEFALSKNNADFAMKMIEKCDISKVISFFPLKNDTVKNLLNSAHIYEFLKCIAKNRASIENLILERKDQAPVLSWTQSCSEYEEVKDESVDEKAITFLYYQKPQQVAKLGIEVPLFNLLFFINQRYTLDELVKVLSCDQIKELNSIGYIIGKWVSYTNYPYNKLNENMNYIIDKEDQCTFAQDSNRLNSTIKDIQEVEISAQGKRGQTCFAFKDALRMYKLTQGNNEDMIDYLANIILKSPGDFELFYPEIVRCLLVFLPSGNEYSAKLISKFLPDEEAVINIALMQKGMTKISSLKEDPYEVYYDAPIRLKMWKDLTEYIVDNGYEKALKTMINQVDKMLVIHKNNDPQAAELFRCILISLIRFPNLDQSNIAAVLTHSAPLWKVLKLVFIEELEALNNGPLSDESADLYNCIFKNKQYFINPLECLVFNKNFDLAQDVLQFALDNDLTHKICNESKKNDLFHVHHIIKNNGSESVIQSWKAVCKTVQSKQSSENPHLDKVIQNFDESTDIDQDLAKNIKLPK